MRQTGCTSSRNPTDYEQRSLRANPCATHGAGLWARSDAAGPRRWRSNSHSVGSRPLIGTSRGPDVRHRSAGIGHVAQSVCMEGDSELVATAFHGCRSQAEPVTPPPTRGPRPQQARRGAAVGRSHLGETGRVAPCLPGRGPPSTRNLDASRFRAGASCGTRRTCLPREPAPRAPRQQPLCAYGATFWFMWNRLPGS